MKGPDLQEHLNVMSEQKWTLHSIVNAGVDFEEHYTFLCVWEK